MILQNNNKTNFSKLKMEHSNLTIFFQKINYNEINDYIKQRT